MKRLLDESTDELTRSLLSAGVEHRPPPGNRAQVIVALGAGSALGLFSANAFAWLGTTAGKVTAAGVAVGVAGAVFIANPGWLPSQQGGAAASARASGAEAASTRVERSGLVPAAGLEPGSPPAAGSVASLEPAAVHDAIALDDVAGDELRADEPRAEEREPVAQARAERASERRKKAWARKKLLARKRASGAAADNAEVALAGSGVEADEREASSALDTEVRMVDEMHGAARRNDNVALARYVALYRESFPDGQLKKEVAGFEARLERSDAP